MTTRPNYSLALRQHLAQYKREVLKVDGDGQFRKGTRSYPHILARGQEDLNILPSIHKSFWAWFKQQPIKLQQDFHHLNSSQAMAFNLFCPAIMGLDRDLLLRVLGVEWGSAEICFEKVLDAKEGTNVDVFVQLSSGKRVLVEVKLSEQKFGVCRDDLRHQIKWRDVYCATLRDRVGKGCLEPEFFFKHYQLLRNIYHLKPEDRLVLLFPRANEKLQYCAGWIQEHLSTSTQRQVRVVYLEDVVAGLLKASEACVWKEFADKYLF